MEYNRIVAVTGLPGLYEILSSKNDGAIVRSLDDNATKFISSRVHNLSHLESIEIYTVRDNVNLVDVFNAMKGSTEKLPDAKDAKALKAYFEKVYGDMDFERVYSSDMKKMVKWFEVLNKNGVDFTLNNGQEEEAVETEEAPATEAKEAKEPKAKKAKAEPKAEATEAAGDAEEKPKKTTRKKKTEE